MAKKHSPSKIINQEDLDKITESWLIMIKNFVHDITTPLTSIRLMGKTFEKISPQLLEGYRLAVSHQMVNPSSIITERHLKALETMGANISQQAAETQTFINLLYPYNQKMLGREADSPIHIFASIQGALKKYPFVNKDQLALIHLDYQNDFSFPIDSFFIEQLFFNLIKDALFYIDKASKGEVYIYTEKQEEFHVLHFKNTAGNLTQNASSQVFKSFFLKQDGGMVPGLGFYRLKLLLMGGDIIHHTEPGQYTNFEIKFPIL